jgi:hypothetical protein
MAREDDLTVLLLPTPAALQDTEAALVPKAKRTRQAERLKPLPGTFSRVPIQWLVKPHKPSPFDAKGKVFLALLWASHWGQKDVRLSDPTIAALDMPERTKQWCVARLCRDGWVRVSHKGPGHVLAIQVLLLAG